MTDAIVAALLGLGLLCIIVAAALVLLDLAGLMTVFDDDDCLKPLPAGRNVIVYNDC